MPIFTSKFSARSFEMFNGVVLAEMPFGPQRNGHKFSFFISPLFPAGLWPEVDLCSNNPEEKGGGRGFGT